MKRGIATKPIALIGMPGSSKTTTGKVLARLTGRTFLDTDSMYVSVYDESIATTFQTQGEDVFRSRESAILWEACQNANAVIATGGGIVVRQANVMVLTQMCYVVELYASPQTLYERVKRSTARPLLQNSGICAIEQLYEKRGELYRACADLRICTDKITPAQAAEQIAQAVQGL